MLVAVLLVAYRTLVLSIYMSCRYVSVHILLGVEVVIAKFTYHSTPAAVLCIIVFSVKIFVAFRTGVAVATVYRVDVSTKVFGQRKRVSTKWTSVSHDLMKKKDKVNSDN